MRTIEDKMAGVPVTVDARAHIAGRLLPKAQHVRFTLLTAICDQTGFCELRLAAANLFCSCFCRCARRCAMSRRNQMSARGKTIRNADYAQSRTLLTQDEQ
jgi:hypothetical protein